MFFKTSRYGLKRKHRKRSVLSPLIISILLPYSVLYVTWIIDLSAGNSFQRKEHTWTNYTLNERPMQTVWNSRFRKRKKLLNVVIFYKIHRFEAHWKSREACPVTSLFSSSGILIVTSSCLKFNFNHIINMLVSAKYVYRDNSELVKVIYIKSTLISVHFPRRVSFWVSLWNFHKKGSRRWYLAYYFIIIDIIGLEKPSATRFPQPFMYSTVY